MAPPFLGNGAEQVSILFEYLPVNGRNLVWISDGIVRPIIRGRGGLESAEGHLSLRIFLLRGGVNSGFRGSVGSFVPEM